MKLATPSPNYSDWRASQKATNTIISNSPISTCKQLKAPDWLLHIDFLADCFFGPYSVKNQFSSSRGHESFFSSFHISTLVSIIAYLFSINFSMIGNATGCPCLPPCINNPHCTRPLDCVGNQCDPMKLALGTDRVETKAFEFFVRKIHCSFDIPCMNNFYCNMTSASCDPHKIKGIACNSSYECSPPLFCTYGSCLATKSSISTFVATGTFMVVAVCLLLSLCICFTSIFLYIKSKNRSMHRRVSHDAESRVIRDAVFTRNSLIANTFVVSPPTYQEAIIVQQYPPMYQI